VEGVVLPAPPLRRGPSFNRNPTTRDGLQQRRRAKNITSEPLLRCRFGAANGRNFVDTLRRPDVEFQNDWIATLFLVSGPKNPGTGRNPTTIYIDSEHHPGLQNFFFFTNEQGLFKAGNPTAAHDDDRARLVLVAPISRSRPWRVGSMSG
jgi:hypothetical protein